MIRFETFYYLTESYDDEYPHADEHFLELVDENASEIISSFLEGKPRISWKVVDANRLIKIWKDFAKTGVVRDEKGIQQIKNIILNNIARLRVTNVLTGHTPESPSDFIESVGYEDQLDLEDEKTFEKFLWEYLESDDDLVFISDYGSPQLEKIFPELYKEDDPEKLLYIIDRVLNVVHHRSDLAALFVQGGQTTLNKIADYQGEEEE